MNQILIIEDEKETRDMFVEALTEENYETIEAKNGQEGIRKIEKYCPDLIICNVTMSKLNGYQVLRFLRQNPDTAQTPFIFTSAFSDENERYQAIKMGANNYLRKPFTIEQLLEAIANLANFIDQQRA